MELVTIGLSPLLEVFTRFSPRSLLIALPRFSTTLFQKIRLHSSVSDKFLTTHHDLEGDNR